MLTSVTNFIKQFFPKFDASAVSEKIAPDRGVGPAELMAEWKEIGKTASRAGTAVHEYARWMFSNNISPQPWPDEIKLDSIGLLTIQLIDACDKIYSKGFLPIEAEKIIFSSRLGLAGTVDLLLKDPAGPVIILDWKTNKELKIENPFETGLPPIDHLEDSNLNHYALQLSIYQYILEAEDYYPAGQEYRRLIVHLTETDNRVYSCKYLKDEIENMLI
uniref:Putative PD-(D/E)XK nuclease superfamily protein n=1 Tax=viral metagenome TaxID=1070528 RepID=A0A6M3K3P2_9ZZZZ